MQQQSDTFNIEKDLNLPPLEQPQKVNKQQLKEIILKYQDDKQKGYYTFKNWGKLHSQLFGMDIEPLPQIILNLWRILKLINFGDDFIPTGLIFDTLVTLLLMVAQTKSDVEKNKAIEEVEGLLRSIFFKFIQFNGKYLSEEQKDELAFFKVIRPVAEGYRKIIGANFDDQSESGQKVLDKLSRNQQLYKMHDVFVYKKNLQKLKKIEEQFKQCTFQPDLSYTSRSVGTESRYMQASRNKKSQNFASSHLIKDPDYIIPEEQYEQQKSFKANPVPNYPEVNPIGVNEHLQRMQKSRQIKKINSLRVYSSGGGSANKTIKQFGIQQRDKQRKQKVINSFKILFNIKVEVGKRIYRVKVRQNMGISDVVKAIQMMVGFKHPDVQQIVKGYFINWEIKMNKKHPLTIEEYSYE